MRERILAVIEKNSRISVKELADLLGENEAAVAAEIAEILICIFIRIFFSIFLKRITKLFFVSSNIAIINIFQYPFFAIFFFIR